MANLASINIRFGVDLKEFSSKMQDSLRTIDKVGQKFQDVGRSMSAFVTLPILGAGAAAIKFASDFEESNNKVDVAFGASADSVKEFSKTTLETFGIAKSSAVEMASLFGDMATSMGLPRGAAAKMSTSLVGLAGDLASFKNIGIEQAQTALAGIFTSETESLKKLGIVMTEAALQEYALAQGIRTKVADMGQAEKVQLRYNYIMAKTTNAQGDFARTGGGAANQMRIFQETLKEIATSLGEVILPVFTKIISKVNEWLKAFNNLSEGTRTTILVVAGIAAALGPLALAIGGIASSIPLVVAGFGALSAAVGLSLGPITAIVAGLAAVAYVVVNNWGPIKKTLVDVANYFVDLYNNSTVFRGAIEYIILSFKNMWAVAKMTFNNVLATVGFVGNNIFNFFKTLGGLIKSILTFDVDGLKKALSTGFSQIGTDAVSFFRKLGENGKSTAAEIGENIKTALKNTLDGRNIAKIVIPKEKIDTSQISEAVAEAVKTGVTGGAGGSSRKKVTPLDNSLKPAGFADVKNPDAKISASFDFAVVNPEIDAMAQKLILLEEVATQVSESLSGAFGALGDSIVDSLGLASNGLQGFVATMLKTVVDLIQIIVKQIVANQALAMSNAITGATSSGAATGPLAIFSTPAFIATAIGGVIAAFAAIPKFETGGIVSGSSMYGDKILARVNSGEMIANDKQQKKIWAAMNTGGGDVSIVPSIKLVGSDFLIMFERAQARKNRIG
jgi:hypothetical protein